MATRGILPPPLEMIFNTYYPLPPQPPRPSPQYDAPPRRPPVQQSPPQQQCSGTRVVAAKKMTVERSVKNVCMEEGRAEKTTVKRSAENVFMEGHNEGGMNLEPGELDPSSAGTG